MPDVRKRQGERHALAAILALACSAMLCGSRSCTAIAEWGRTYGARLTRALGFTRPSPCAATLHTVLRQVNREALEAKLGVWAEGLLVGMPPQDIEEGIAIDGKTLRGSQQQGAPGAPLLSALAHRLGVPLAQQAVADKTNEMPVARDLLRQVILEGRVVPMDALLTQRPIAQPIVEAGGHLCDGRQREPAPVAGGHCDCLGAAAYCGRAPDDGRDGRLRAWPHRAAAVAHQ